MNEYLRVGVRAELMAAGFKVPPQLDIVEDLAIEHDPDRAGLVGDRLPASGEIDDAQARVSQTYGTIDQHASAIRTAML